MTLKQLCTAVLLQVLSFAALAQGSSSGSIKGKVTTSDQKPAAYVSILIREIKRTLVTDEEGNFQASRIPAGTYQLEISLTGHETLDTIVNIQAGATTSIFLQLRVSEKQLEEVIIRSYRNRFIKTQSPYVAKMPLKNLENPQVYTTVSQALLQDQLNVVYADALKNIPGVIMQLENNSAGGTVTSRGFSTQSFLRNGVPGIIGGGTLDPANIESIEAIKGPSGALYGTGLVSFGGLFNRITKKPEESFHARIGYTGGGFGLSRLDADINTPLDKDHKLLMRFNAAKYAEGSFQDAGFKNYFFLAPVISYQLSDKTKLTVEAEYKKEKANSFYRLFVDGANTTGVRDPRDLNFDFKRRFSSDDIYTTTNTANLFAELQHQFSDAWQGRATYTYLSSQADGMSGYLSMKAGNDSLIRNSSYTEYSNSAASDLQYNLNGDFKIGRMRNRLLVGVDIYSATTRSSSPGNVAFDVVSASKPGAAYSALNRLALLDRVKNLPFTRNKAVQNMYSAYVQEVLNITPQLIAMASIRVDYFDNPGTKNLTRDTTTGKYDQTAVSPKFGLVYQLVPDQVSLFGNYSNGFQNIAPILQPDGTISSFKPSQANQWEGGIKWGLSNGILSGSLSYYAIRVSDVTRPDAPDRPAFTVQNGTQYSKGIEGEITAMPFKGFHVLAGYAYNDSKLKKSSPALEGLRPGSAGPEHIANLWLSYHLSEGALKGAGIGFGGNYAGKNIVNVSTTSLYTLPSYTVLNATLSYEQSKYRLIARVDNLTDQRYWVGWSTTIPQMPIRFSAAAYLKL
ncbi:MAG: TonB-dependent receptor [Candidatus Pseudobacter hemicellulosilyticus]|uniref:TonB-dependent receptor n=1 Tax=Candidatus Pseudobacter hemicellulosilyticus TaxID=3121375 RepID=A0AAJ5WUX6_9BACT|nr:MAG: TonB-dependent receptor [Pseudobacter sp.]